jgi:hypothetical protein
VTTLQVTSIFLLPGSFLLANFNAGLFVLRRTVTDRVALTLLSSVIEIA